MSRVGQNSFIRWSKRTLPFAAAVVTGLWVAEYWPGRAREAEALVFETRLRGIAGVARYLSGFAKAGETRTGLLNGNRVRYRVCTTNDSIEELLDHYSETYRCEPPVPTDQWAVADALARDLAQHGAEPGNTFRLATERMGLFAAIDVGPSWPADMRERVRRYLTTGLVEELGKAKVVVAMRPDRAKRTTFLTFWPDRGFNVRNLEIPSDGSDAPGRDLPDVPRCPAAQRITTIEERASFACAYIGIYQSQDPRGRVREFYETRMPLQGWRRHTPGQSGIAETEDLDVLFFDKAGQKECFVTVQSSALDARTQVTVMCRWPSGPQTVE